MTEPRPRGVFFVDLDGTLVGPDGVHPRVWAALDALRDAGWRLSVCTGRPGRGEALAIAARLDPAGLHVFESGAVVLDAAGRLVHAWPLPADLVARVAAFSREEGLTLEAYSSDGRFLVEAANDPLISAHEALLSLRAEESPWPPPVPLVRLLWNAPTPRWLALESRARAVLGPLSGHAGRTPRIPGVSFISITAEGVSKATGVRFVCDTFGVPPGAAAMAGDDHNDLQALALVGVRFVPRDGADAARALATRIIEPAAEGGVYTAATELLRR